MRNTAAALYITRAQQLLPSGVSERPGRALPTPRKKLKDWRRCDSNEEHPHGGNQPEGADYVAATTAWPAHHRDGAEKNLATGGPMLGLSANRNKLSL